MKLSRRSFLVGATAVAAASALPVMKPVGLSMRTLWQYVPAETVTRFDVLYGTLRIGDIVTFPDPFGFGVSKEEPRSFVITAISDRTMTVRHGA